MKRTLFFIICIILYNANVFSQSNGFSSDQLPSIKETPSIPSISIYPNPVKDLLKLEIQNAIPYAMRLSITNVFGKELYSCNLNAGTRQFQYPVNQFPKGIYFVQMLSGKKKISKKWIKD